MCVGLVIIDSIIDHLSPCDDDSSINTLKRAALHPNTRFGLNGVPTTQRRRRRRVRVRACYNLVGERDARVPDDGDDGDDHRGVDLGTTTRTKRSLNDHLQHNYKEVNGVHSKR